MTILKNVIEKTSPLDMLIHLGDAEGSETKIAGRKQTSHGSEKAVIWRDGTGKQRLFSNLDRKRN